MSESTGLQRKMIDLHMHLLPGVDDGAEDPVMSNVMMLTACEQGVSGIFCTPHSEDIQDSEELRFLFESLNRRLGRRMKLYLGCEVYCEAAIMGRVIENLRAGKYPTMNGSNYVLTEFYVHEEYDGAVFCVDALVNGGYKPIIAHMERYDNLCNDEMLVNELRRKGALIQVNAYSLFEEADDSVRNWARKLVLEQKADFLGSDAHKTYHRPPNVRSGLEWLYGSMNEDAADAIAWKNAQEILLGTV